MIEKLRSEEELIKKTRYLELVNKISESLNKSIDLNNIAKIIKEYLHLYTCEIMFIDKKTKIAKVEGFSSSLPVVAKKMLLRIKIDLNKNKKAARFFNKQDTPAIFTTRELVQKFVDREDIIKAIFKTFPKLMNGEELFTPIFNSYKEIVGAMIFVKKSGEVFNEDELSLAKNICNSISSNLEVYKLAYYDDLTGLPNNKILKKQLAEKIKTNKHFSLVTFRINDYKKVIISRGEEIGDKCMIMISEKLQAIVSEYDPKIIISRPSSTANFSFILNTKDHQKVNSFVHKLSDAFCEPCEVEGNSIDLSINIGVCYSETKTDPEAVIKNCNIALLEAIKKGKNQSVVYDEKMTINISKQIKLEEDLKTALLKKDFVVYYQPKTDITGNILGYEALARWSKGGKIYLPETFINKIEEMGLIDKLFDIVLDNVCKDIKKWKIKNKEISINISPFQFKDKNFLTKIKESISIHKIDPRKITFEIIETGIMDESNLPVIKELHDLGFRFSIDDFGSGYSKYSAIRDLSKEKIIDELKIDKSFIKDISRHEESVIITSIIDLAEKLNLDVVIEGVEKPQQFMILKVIRPKIIIQGWILSKAFPPEEMFTLSQNIFKDKISKLIDDFSEK